MVLADAALAKSTRLIGELSKLGLALDSDDQGDISPTSIGASSTFCGSTSSSESDDESWRTESECKSNATLQSLEAELCQRMRRIEEELRLLRKLHENGISVAQQVATHSGDEELHSKGLTWSKYPVSLQSMSCDTVTHPHEQMPNGVCCLPCPMCPVCKQAMVTKVLHSNAFDD